MRLGQEPKGLVGAGWSVSEPERFPHWDAERAAAGDTLPMIQAEFDVLSDVPIVPLADLEQASSDGFSWTPQSSGIEIPSGLAAQLERLLSTGLAVPQADHSPGAPTFVEGSLQRAVVNRYERSRPARLQCIEHYTPVCWVCTFSFSRTYGPDFAGFIHVHHVVPLAQRGEEYQLDPILDLRPVCPNCHAALHYGDLSIEELRARLGRTDSA
ncbi:MAG TPA: HNH endonuclease [Polyangiaceae bacterium]|nr:HNH endonuclease [Polyangiaceae bacterium]